MNIKNSYFFKLNKIARIILKEKYGEDTDNYMAGTKCILYFIGQSILSIKYLKENLIADSKDINLDLIEKNQIAVNDFSFNYESVFNSETILNRQYKENIIDILKYLSVDELAMISLGQLYESLITNKQRKIMGQVYTPDYIVKYMVSLKVTKDTIINNPYFKVLDPSCGGGYFLLEIYYRLKEIFTKYYTDIIHRNPNIKNELDKGIHLFILKNNVFGTDIDPFAVYMTRISLIQKGIISDNIRTNIEIRDILIDEIEKQITTVNDKQVNFYKEGKFDLIIGNPPYIGHKTINKDYRKQLQKIYHRVYSDKADISYCFFQKGNDLLVEKGDLIFITSRYFLEAPSANNLRNFIKSNFEIEKIIDFYGHNVFKGVGISPVIIKAKKKRSYDGKFSIYRYKGSMSVKDRRLDLDNDFDKYYVPQKDLDDKRWLLINKRKKEIFLKIDTQGDYYLEEICECNQGIITGCDKAFIVDSNTIEEHKLELDICKPWVKNSEVRKYRKIETKRFVLYTDMIDSLDNYPYTKQHIMPFRDRLMKRRECIRGTREWYKLQWGRNINIFKQPKILFPYKAASNEFTLENREVCCSADVYILSIKDKFKDKISIEYLLAFLNSALFEFYFKSVAKKINHELYEYYPNKLMGLKIKLGDNREFIDKLVKRIMVKYEYKEKINESNRNKKFSNNVKYSRDKIEEEISLIDNYFFKLYNLKEMDIDSINRTISS